ncbi:class I SAM-dependent methyltransferase [Sporichthya polymorpha]|uniref:class I SAM-dependent methyltransferase n=1 Tax=Sporichthya polymorpha TaxID=35751 RepID=UPI00036F99F9|nr:methyltransferase domain-containing protein [Sporichthya polymorpha]
MATERVLPDPGAGLDPATMPAHWLLAQMGKTVMRPGGGDVSDVMLRGLGIGPEDDVVDLAPGLGTTVRRVEALRPRSFHGLDRTEVEAERSRRQVSAVPYTCVVAHPSDTGLPTGSASVLYGEACLSLETNSSKAAILTEAARLLRPGGRLGLHELLLTPDDLPAERKREVGIQISQAVRVGARPLTRAEWTDLLAEHGFQVTVFAPSPMLLLSPATVVRDEGVAGTARLVGNILRRPVVTRRVAHLWRVMHRLRHNLGATAIIAVRD